MLPRPVAAACLLLAGCTLHAESVLQVDGVELPVSHEESLELRAWPPGGLEVSVTLGDVHVVPGERNSVRAVLHETAPGDARLRLRGRAVTFETESGQPAAIGSLVLTVLDPLPALSLVTRVGDVRADLVEVEGALVVDTGSGDVRIAGGRAGGRSELRTAVGDVALASFEGTVVEASTGLGGVELRGVRAERADLRSGMGDVVVRRCAIGTLTAHTALGDVRVEDSEVLESDLETGLGDVHE